MSVQRKCFQLEVFANYADGSSRDVTRRDNGMNYVVSNAEKARDNGNGFLQVSEGGRLLHNSSDRPKVKIKEPQNTENTCRADWSQEPLSVTFVLKSDTPASTPQPPFCLMPEPTINYLHKRPRVKLNIAHTITIHNRLIKLY